MKRYLLPCLLLLSFSAHAALHKWVDADGKVHYSDEPPPANVKDQSLKVPSGSAAASSSGVPAAKSVAERDAEYKKAQKAKQEAEQKSAKQQEEARVKQKNCESAQQSLQTLETGGRMVTYDANGERSYIDDQARQQRIEDARKSINTNCTQ